MRDTINTLIEAGSFKMLVSAVQATELADLLRGAGNFTVFAPDDEAFSKMPKDTLDLLKNVPKLSAIVMYHVVAGKLTTDQISQMDAAKTIQGQEIKICSHKWRLHNKPKINDANMTDADIETDNGMIHALDKVLTPNIALTCSVCGMGFETMDALTFHTKRIHMEESTTKPMSIVEAKSTVEGNPMQMSAR